MTDSLHIVYRSQLATGNDCQVFAPICRSARTHNVARGIAGALLFDGQRFLHWLYGPPQAVTALMQAIRADARHHDLVVLAEALRTAGDANDNDDWRWRDGFIDADLLDAFVAAHGAGDAHVFGALPHLVAQADLGPVLNVR